MRTVHQAHTHGIILTMALNTFDRLGLALVRAMLFGSQAGSNHEVGRNQQSKLTCRTSARIVQLLFA